jgi:hypothetical protein
MNVLDQDIVQAIVRTARRQAEQDLIRAIGRIRLELTVLAQADRIRELEQLEWAELEELD